MMQAEKITAISATDQVQIQSGTVESTDDCYRILAQDRHYSATRAFSCLVEPRAGDVVLFSVDGRQQCHILSIIERPDESDTRLSFPGDVSFNADHGALNIQTREDMNLVSEQGISQVSQTYTLATEKALLNTGHVTAIGKTLTARIRQVQTFADRVETVAVNWLQKLTNSLRRVEGVDQLKSGDSIHTVDNLYSMRSKQAAILAKKDIKVDAERIHMG